MESQTQEQLDLGQWKVVRERGALIKSGHVLRSTDGTRILRTGDPSAIAAEARFAEEAFRRGFPVPEVLASGTLRSGLGYFIERSVGRNTFGQLLGEEFEARSAISKELFEACTGMGLNFVKAQLRPENRQAGPGQLREGIQLANVLAENADVPPALVKDAVALAEERTAGLPLVLSHGDLTPFNAMEGGVIDFEHRFVAPAGYDAVTYVTFHRFWDHPLPNGTGTMKRWEFTRGQRADYLSQLDSISQEAGVPALSNYFDDFLMLKSIWALSYERTDEPNSPQARRWEWRKRVALYCMERYLAGKPIDSDSFRSIGLGSRYTN